MISIAFRTALLVVSVLTMGLPCHAADSRYTQPQGQQGQEIQDLSGNAFMEEETPVKETPKPARIPIDLSNVGVPVDPQGRIVPMIDRSSGGVRQNYSHIDVYNEPFWNFLPQQMYNTAGQPLNVYGQPIYPGPAPYMVPNVQPYYPNTNLGINLGRNFGLNVGSNPYGSGYGMPNLNPLTAPNGTSSYTNGPSIIRPPQWNAYPGTGYPGAGYPLSYPGIGYPGTGYPIGYPGIGYPGTGYPIGYPGTGFAPPVGGFGLNLFAPSTTQWQSTSTITPLIPNLNAP